MLLIAGISIALFVSALLLVKKNKSKSDLFLLFWLLLNVVHLGFYYLQYVDQLFEYPSLLGIQLPFPLLQGVFLYFYVSSVTNQAPKKQWYYLLHLIPAILSYLYLISFFMLPSAEKIKIFEQGGHEDYALFMSLLVLAVFLSGIIYVIWCSILLIRHKRNIRSQFSSIEEINLSWLLFLVCGIGIIWTLVIISQNDAVIYQAIAVFVILIGFFGVQQKNIFNQVAQQMELSKTENIAIPIVEKSHKEKYQSSGLSEQDAAQHYKNLNELMNDEMLYKNANLSLAVLAESLDVHPNYLSQIINDKGGQSFYDYVNTYRVNEFKKLIADAQHEKFTLIALAYECGFNSKSTFNRYFKKITGLTPSQYVNK